MVMSIIEWNLDLVPVHTQQLVAALLHYKQRLQYDSYRKWLHSVLLNKSVVQYHTFNIWAHTTQYNQAIKLYHSFICRHAFIAWYTQYKCKVQTRHDYGLMLYSYQCWRRLLHDSQHLLLHAIDNVNTYKLHVAIKKWKRFVHTCHIISNNNEIGQLHYSTVCRDRVISQLQYNVRINQLNDMHNNVRHRIDTRLLVDCMTQWQHALLYIQNQLHIKIYSKCKYMYYKQTTHAVYEHWYNCAQHSRAVRVNNIIALEYYNSRHLIRLLHITMKQIKLLYYAVQFNYKHTYRDAMNVWITARRKHHTYTIHAQMCDALYDKGCYIRLHASFMHWFILSSQLQQQRYEYENNPHMINYDIACIFAERKLLINVFDIWLITMSIKQQRHNTRRHYSVKRTMNKTMNKKLIGR